MQLPLELWCSIQPHLVSALPPSDTLKSPSEADRDMPLVMGPGLAESLMVLLWFHVAGALYSVSEPSSGLLCEALFLGWSAMLLGSAIRFLTTVLPVQISAEVPMCSDEGSNLSPEDEHLGFEAPQVIR